MSKAQTQLSGTNFKLDAPNSQTTRSIKLYNHNDSKEHESRCAWEWYDILIVLTNLASIIILVSQLISMSFDIGMIIALICTILVYMILCCVL